MISNDSVMTTYGSCIDLELEYTDEDGAPEDVTGDTFAILRASCPAFEAAVFTKTDAVQGKVHFHLPAADAAKLFLGRVNWFRVQRTLPDGCEDNSEAIWVSVQ